MSEQQGGARLVPKEEPQSPRSPTNSNDHDDFNEEAPTHAFKNALLQINYIPATKKDDLNAVLQKISTKIEIKLGNLIDIHHGLKVLLVVEIDYAKVGKRLAVPQVSSIPSY